ncbi:surface antigen variable number repeat protein [Gluconacetobacter diazotrophicus PA1 5]|uniref:POTRA domain-containing protein n=1 Tax=Gluconacetobacter diazotrophicus TaxID=33996 RepID=A0A7W4I5N4_GLUDI|nr:POTRA domain-containing protein [Gluconacetobacter diazotrophicus]ACI51022.1 surface antigen variable number repeat protein [Gluconacetobacter diazotrophicus PA1 5]MBB2156721.1 hypothetical protein [Gluconacetobacter diazotrophicus]
MRTIRHIMARSALAVALATGFASVPALHDVAFAAAPGPNDPLKLKSVVVTGNKQVSTEDILAAVPFHVGDTVTRNQIAAAMQDVMAVYQKKNVGLKLGGRTKFAGKAVYVQWVIEEQAPGTETETHVGLVVDKIVFEGNKKVSTADLTAATALRPGSAITQATMAADQEAVQKLYQKRDISASVQVVPAQKPGDSHVTLTYQINEKAGD